MKQWKRLAATALCVLLLPASVTAVASGERSPTAAVEAGRKKKKGVQITPKNVDFGIVPIGERRAQTFLIDNNTNEDVAFDLEDPPDPFQFSQGTPRNFVLLARDYRVIVVEYVSTDEGRHSGTIFVNSTYERRPIQTVTLKGRGGPESSLNVQVRPFSVDYGFSEPNVGNPELITIENFGETPREVLVQIGGFPTFHISGTIRSEKFTLAGGETRNMVIGFRPKSPGKYSGTVITKVLNVGPQPRAVNPVALYGRCVPSE